MSTIVIESNRDCCSNWRITDMQKRGENGRILISSSGRSSLSYYEEIATGDLYAPGSKEGTLDTFFIIRKKAFGMFLVLPCYTAISMQANLIKTMYGVSTIFWKVVPAFIKDLFCKDFFVNSKEQFVKSYHTIQEALIQILKSPWYAIQMELATLFILVYPLDGLAWFAKLERAWHGVSYQKDVRYRINTSNSPSLCYSFWKGKVLYLGYCMRKRGNRFEKIGNKARFIEVKTN